MSSPSCRRPRSVFLVSTTVLIGLSIVGAGSATEPPNSKDLIVGDWTLDLSKSKFCNPAEAPKQSLRKIMDEGYGMVSVYWTGTNADGTPIDRRYVYFNDGRKVPAGEFRGTPLQSKESMTFRLINPHRVVWEHWSPDNKVTSRYVREVSADGQTMTQTDTLLNRPGCVDKEVYERQ